VNQDNTHYNNRLHKLFTTCIRRCLVSRACDWMMPALSAILFIFTFQFRSAFLLCRSAKPHSGVLVYAISGIGRCRKCG